jgi:hypothetical protein
MADTLTLRVSHALDQYRTMTGVMPKRILMAPATEGDLIAEVQGNRQYFDGNLKFRGVPIQRDATVPAGQVMCDDRDPTREPWELTADELSYVKRLEARQYLPETIVSEILKRRSESSGQPLKSEPTNG